MRIRITMLSLKPMPLTAVGAAAVQYWVVLIIRAVEGEEGEEVNVKEA